MASESRHPVLRFLRRMTASDDETTDERLLARFVAQSDEDAFSDLVRRHGSLVLAVCRRVLANDADAEDAFQATFLVLARHARSIRRPEALASWLHGVAHRTALHARADSARRRERESQTPTASPSDPADDAARRDLRHVLDGELSRLPERYRVPLVLCYLEGRTQEEAARQLGCPRQTIATRLTRGCDRLRGRLARRGVTLSVAGLASALTEASGAAGVRLALLEAVKTAAAGMAAGEAVVGVVSPRVLALTRAVQRSLSMKKLKVMFALLLTVGLITTAAGVSLRLPAAEEQGEPTRDAAGGERPMESPTNTDQEKLQGTWSLIAAESGPGRASGDEVKRLAGKMDFAGGKVVWEQGGDAKDAAFQLDANREPKTIDFDIIGEAYRGIYRLDGDRFTVCVTRVPLERPTAFATQIESKFPMVLTYQRSNVSDQGKLEGTWTVATHEIEGDRSDTHGYKGSKVTIAGDLMTIDKPGKGTQEATIRVDPASSPKSLDLTPLREKKPGATLPGIYRLEGDTLTLCLPTIPGRVRPTAFTSTPGHRQVMVLERAKQ